MLSFCKMMLQTIQTHWTSIKSLSDVFKARVIFISCYVLKFLDCLIVFLPDATDSDMTDNAVDEINLSCTLEFIR